MPGDAGLAGILIRVVVHPRETLAASVLAMRSVLAGLKGDPRGTMARAPDLEVAIRSADYLALDDLLSRLA